MSTKNVMEKAWNAGKGALGEVSGPALHATALGVMVGGAYWAAQTMSPGVLEENMLDSGQTMLMAEGAVMMMLCGVEMTGGAIYGAIHGWKDGAERVGQVVKENLSESVKTVGKGLLAVGVMAASAWLCKNAAASGGLDLSVMTRLAGLAVSGTMGLAATGLGLHAAVARYLPEESEPPQAKSEEGEAAPASLTQAKLAKWRQGKEEPAAPKAVGLSLG